ncbi:MAG: aminotransferase class I/II-fold pyridoxal phosphate-dependent enzyme [Armatimonadetes bacterium]|nr:aminotransferase class I/II-fold pyridoxal phosphate-dependent enzyme [Armatimonadota bacterium]
MSTTAPKATPGRTGTALLYSLIDQLKTYPDGISLGRGDPDFDTPPHIRAAVEAALREEDPAKPVPTNGLSELRQLISKRVKAVNNIDADPETDIVVTNGGQEAVFLMIQAAVGPGDEVLVADPNYNTYTDAIAFAGAVRVAVPTFVHENYAIDPDRLRAAITPRSRAILMVSPNNPTAAVIPPALVKELCQIAEEHDLIIIADDIYDRFLYDGAQHLSPSSLPGMKKRTMTLNAFSKTYSMCGWRCGWITGPADLMRQVRRLKEGTSGATSIVAQRGGIAALSGPQHTIQEFLETYIRRRKVVMAGADKIGFRYGVPQGGQFIFVDASKFGMSSLDLAKYVLERARVLAYPGRSFGEGWDQYLRVTFLAPEETLATAFSRMHDALKDLG